MVQRVHHIPAYTDERIRYQRQPLFPSTCSLVAAFLTYIPRCVPLQPLLFHFNPSRLRPKARCSTSLLPWPSRLQRLPCQSMSIWLHVLHPTSLQQRRQRPRSLPSPLPPKARKMGTPVTCFLIGSPRAGTLPFSLFHLFPKVL
jgi:hypothetical protein